MHLIKTLILKCEGNIEKTPNGHDVYELVDDRILSGVISRKSMESKSKLRIQRVIQPLLRYHLP